MARAQRTVENVQNEFVRAHVITPSNSGRFWITTTGRDAIRFLFATDPSFVTSNIVFRVSRGTDVNYYCNQPLNYTNPGGRPTPPTGTAAFKPYDSLRVTGDTLTVYWSAMSGYNVQMRFIAEKRATIYDSGGDLLLEFSSQLQPFAPAAELGILLMLDTYNSQAASNGGGGQGDYASVTTSNGYFPVNSVQRNTRFTGASVPQWYHVGNFLELDPRNDIFPIHRLSGRSHGGALLTAPNVFAVGDWNYFKYLAWDLPASHYSSNFSDCATMMRWEGLGDQSTVRTAFGLSDKSGNSNFTCRDDNLFVDIAAPRLISQAVKNGPYSLDTFDVEMWVSNTNEMSAVTPTIRLQTPINSYPSYPVPGNRLTLVSSATRADTQVYIASRQTVKLRWRLAVNTASTDTLAQLNFFVRYGTGAERRFLEECSPLITVKGWREPPPPPDTLAPRIELIDLVRDQTVRWNFRLYDRHPGYAWDLGMTSPVSILSSTNMAVSLAPSAFPSCDTSQTVVMSASVADTSRDASATFRVVDCAGNDSIATIVYTPRPDTFAPESFVARTGGLGDCNSRHYDITLVDSTHQTPLAGDNGFGTVVVMVEDNFRVIVNGGQPILPFQRSVNVVADVIDSMRNGGFALRVFDFAGNETTLPFSYCSRPDSRAPEAFIRPLGAGRFEVTVADRRAWDRGLRRIEEVSNLNANMRIVAPPTIRVGDPETMFVVEAIDLTQRGELVLDIYDSVHTIVGDPQNHVTRATVVYEPGAPTPEDTIAPDITFAPVSGSNGASAIATVDEIHFVGGQRYAYDTGLDSVWIVSRTPNIRLASTIMFIAGDTVTTFAIQVIDTLAIGLRDTIVVGARDRAGNRSSSPYIYPIQPDTKPPVFTGVLDASRSTLTAVLSDERQYDRGLGTIELEDAVNIALRGAVPNIVGRPLEVVRFDVTDPMAPIAGTFVLRDLVGTIDQTPEGAADHVVRVPFTLPSVALEIELPDVVEGGEEVTAAIIARTPIGPDVELLELEIAYSGGSTPAERWLVNGVSVMSPAAGMLRIAVVPTTAIAAGDTIGTLSFATPLNDRVSELRVDVLSERVNGGVGRVIPIRVGSDDTVSTLSLPPAIILVTGDSVTYVNGICDRILTTGRPLDKGLAIVGLRPQPLVRSDGSPFELDLRNLPADGAIAELVTLDGNVAATTLVEGASTTIARRVLHFGDVPQGSYVLRLRSGAGADHTMVVVIE